MMLKKWDELPNNLQTDCVRKYYEILKKKKASLLLKRVFDLFAAFTLLLLLSPTIIILSLIILIEDGRPVFYRQTRITQYGEKFRIFKFRTMVKNADKLGSEVTVDHDPRITKIGGFIRKLRLDEIPQLFNVLAGSMTFVGTRPEAEKYVERYADYMMATLLLPAGITSEASIYFKDEAELLSSAENAEEVYVNTVLPEKMYYNLKSIEKFGFWREIGVMIKTVFAVLGKDYKGDYERTTERLSDRENNRK